jgi:hypothetical protein
MRRIVWIVVVIGILLLAAYAFFWALVAYESSSGPVYFEGPSKWSTAPQQSTLRPPANRKTK